MLPDYGKRRFSGTRGFSVPNPTGGHSFRRPFPFSLPAVENRLVLDSALDILFKTDQYVFAIHSRPPQLRAERPHLASPLPEQPRWTAESILA